MIASLMRRVRGIQHRLLLMLRGVRFSLRTRLQMGENTKLSFRKASIIMTNGNVLIENGGSLIGGNRLCICQGAEIVISKGGHLTFGDDVFIGAYVNLRCSGSITIGNNVRLAQNISVIDANYSRKDGRVGDLIPNKVAIGDNVWIGVNCVLLPGVSIGEGAVIAAGSIVTKNVQPNTMWAGNPAKWVKDL